MKWDFRLLLWPIIKICHIFASALSHLISTASLPPKKKYYSHFAGEKAELKFIKPGSRGAELFIPVWHAVLGSIFSQRHRDDEHNSQILSRRLGGLHGHFRAILNICFEYIAFSHCAVHYIPKTYFYNWKLVPLTNFTHFIIKCIFNKWVGVIFTTDLLPNQWTM